MRRILCSLAIIGSVGVLNASQQPSAKEIVRPDFSGTWTSASGNGVNLPVIEGRGNRPDGQLRVGVEPHKLVISRDADKLIIEEHRASPVQAKMNAVEYGLTGQSIKSHFVIERPGDAAPCETTSKWEEKKLVSTIDVVVPGESDPRHYIETLSISPEGILAVRIQRVGTADSRTLFYRRSK